jgi:GntR family transcriptional regulator
VRAGPQDVRLASVAAAPGSALRQPVRALAAYLQIEEELADRIDSGELEPGMLLPSERELSEQVGVSRMTVRQALGRLEQRGLIVREQGRGTFVAEAKYRQDASVLRGFFEQMVGQGVVPSSAIVERTQVHASRALAHHLDLRLGEPVYKIVRLRSAQGRPVVLETSFFPARLVPGLLELDLEHASIYRLMEERFGARPVRAVQSVEPLVAGLSEAAALEVPLGSALMLVERTSWDTQGRPVEHARDLYRGDRSRFVAELTL